MWGARGVGFRGEALQRYSVTVICQGCIFFKIILFIYINIFIYINKIILKKIHP